MKITVKDWKSRMKREEMRKEDGRAHEPMSPALCRTLRDLVCGEQDDQDCSKCPLRSVDCYSMDDNRAMQTILMELFGSRPAKAGEGKKQKCHSDATESPVTPFKCKTGISYSVDKDKPLRSDSSAKSTKPYPQDTEEDEYRYIDADWLEAVARGLTAGAEKHPGETWRQIPPEEHAARAMRHLNLYRAGDRKDTHLINAAMRCMMAYATEKARGEGKA